MLFSLILLGGGGYVCTTIDRRLIRLQVLGRTEPDKILSISPFCVFFVQILHDVNVRICRYTYIRYVICTICTYGIVIYAYAYVSILKTAILFFFLVYVSNCICCAFCVSTQHFNILCMRARVCVFIVKVLLCGESCFAYK